jgi:hypothetical protein
MAATSAHRILEDLMESVCRCFTPSVAARIVALRAAPTVQRRLGHLAKKNAESKLTAREEAEYDAYVEWLDVIAILQAKARESLKMRGRTR